MGLGGKWDAHAPGNRSRSTFPTVSPLVALLFLGSVGIADSFVLETPAWSSGSVIEIHLQLSAPALALQDGNANWNSSAAEAMAVWDQQLENVRFAPLLESPAQGELGDQVNSAFFSETVYGEKFGPNVLAVTLYCYQPDTKKMTEADTVFNATAKFDSYRGATRIDPVTGAPIYDFRRVAMHEFGHVLGLDHPDRNGQTVAALMNSYLSNLDSLSADDIAGVTFLYGQTITSNLTPVTLQAGDSFTYQITANYAPTSYEASGLPAGLQLDSATGLITGRPSVAGTFAVAITARGTNKDASAVLQLIVKAAAITSNLASAAIEYARNFSYQITATNQPISFQATGLPEGLVLDSATGLITGASRASGTFTILVSAHGPYTDASGLLELIVNAPRIISSVAPMAATAGRSFQYQITANTIVTSYEATGLPAGLTLNPITGAITGTTQTTGDFTITLTAHFAGGDASATIRLAITPTPTYADPVAVFPQLPGAVQALVNDYARSRVYAASGNSVLVVDTVNLKLLRTVTVSRSISDISLSVDGSKLWVAYTSDEPTTAIGIIDLTSLTPIAELNVQTGIRRVREGLAQRLYVVDNTGAVLQLDGATGAIQKRLAENPNGLVIEVSPDRYTLFIGDTDTAAATVRSFDVSTATPIAAQSSQPLGNDGRSLAISHNGQALCFAVASNQNGLHHSIKLPARDLLAAHGSFESGDVPADVAFSPDDGVVYQSAQFSSKVDVFDGITYKLVKSLQLTPAATASKLAVDKTNSYLFVGGSQLEVYRLRSENPAPASSRALLNISTRLRTDAGDASLIGGFVISGTEPKKVLLRAIGPSLPIEGKLADPVAYLYDSTGALVASNDDWTSNRDEILATGAAPGNERESAFVATLDPGLYTAVVSGRDGTTGIALVEAYDLSPSSSSKIANLSTRGFVDQDNSMIGGFIVGGKEPASVVVRAIGPSLHNKGIERSLPDPFLELHDSNGGILAENDDWMQYQEEQLRATGFAPESERESAMLVTVPPGAYTAIVRGAENNTGVALVEIYHLQ